MSTVSRTQQLVGRSPIDISGGISIAKYSSLVCAIGNHHSAIYRSSRIHVRIVHDYHPRNIIIIEKTYTAY